MTKAVVFDCFGVFYTDPVFEYMGRSSTPRHIAAALHQLDRQLTKGDLDKVGFIRRASPLLNISQPEVDEYFFRPHDHNYALIEFVANLRGKYKTALLSNVGAGIMDRYFSPESAKALFDVVVLSAEVGLVKPDPAIFRLVCQKLDVSLEEVTMVDDMQEYIEAARVLGMQGICYKDFAQFLQALNVIEAEHNSSELAH